MQTHLRSLDPGYLERKIAQHRNRVIPFSLASLTFVFWLCHSNIVGAAVPEVSRSNRERAIQLLERTRPLTTLTPEDQLKPLSEEALSLAKELRDRNLHARALWHLGYAQLKGGQFPSALECFYQSRDLYTELQDQADVTLLNLQIGHLFRYHLGDYPTAMAYYRKASESARKQGNAVYIVKALTFIGNLYQDLGELESAVGALTEAVPFSESLQGDEGITAHGVLYLELAKIYIQLKDAERAAFSINQARNLMASLSTNREHSLSRVEVIQGHLLRQSGRFEEAKESYRQAFSMRVKYDEARDNANRLCYLAETERLAGQQGLALEHYQEGLAAWRQARDSKGICEASLGTGKVLLARGAHQEALVFLEECRKLAEENGFHGERKEVYQALSEAYAAAKDPAKALAYRRLFDEWKERVLGAEVATQVVGILNKYEKSRLDREILHLRRQNRWGLAGLLLLATAFAAGMFYWLRQPKVIPSDLPTTDIAPSSQTLPRTEDPDSGSRPKYVRSLLTEEQARPYLNRLKMLMEQDQLYLDPELSVDTLSEKLRLNSKYLSQLINAYIGKSFNDYLNELRFEEAKKLLTDPARLHRTVLEIGHDAGFNSKSTFYRVFKQAVGMTPVEYRAQQSRKGVA